MGFLMANFDQDSFESSVQPKISIITVCLNNEATIADTIQSIAGQTYRNREYIVVDGSSKDGTQDIIKSFQSEIDLFISDEDDGIYDAMNRGIELASGDLVGFIHADDILAHNDVLSDIARVAREQNADSLYGDLVYVDFEDTNDVIRRWKAGSFSHANFQWGWMPPHPTFYVKREFYQKYGGFDLRFGSAADYELMLRFLYKHRISADYIPEVLVKMRKGGTSNRSIKNRIVAHKHDWGAWVHNGLSSFPFWVALKPIRKIHQYF